MANYTGILGAPQYTASLEYIGQATYIVPGFTQSTVNIPPESYVGTDALSPGTLTGHFPLEWITSNHAGEIGPGINEIFYNRIHVTPNPVEFGNLTKNESVLVNVFNAFFTTSQLDSIVEIATPGLTLSGQPSPPTVFGALESRDYTLDAALDVGPPIINASYQFNFAGAINDPILLVTGIRTNPFPYLFQPGTRESLQWRTQILMANNGSEQRVQVRRKPRQVFEGSIGIPTGQGTALDLLMFGWRSNSFAVPISTEGRGLISDTNTSSPNIDVNTDYGDFRVGGFAAIYNTHLDFELVEILSFTTNQIISSINISKVYPAGTKVFPVHIALMESNPVRSTNGYNQRLDFTFLVTSGLELTTGSAPTQYKGLDVFLDEQLEQGGFVKETYNKRIDIVDYDTGVRRSSSPWLKTKEQREFLQVFESQQEVWEYREWLGRRQGRLVPFWMPTFEKNFTVTSAGLITTILLVLDENQIALGQPRTDIAIFTDSGVLLREITGTTDLGDNLQLTLDVTLNIDASEIQYISWLGKKRLNSDIIDITWLGNNVAQSVISVVDINL